ncbi:MAG: hypothetical protein SPL30_09035 [Succinivibrio sp.]|nr:hypothetical protein [Succinivibrio sp.]
MTGQEKSPDQPARTAKELWARVRPDLDSGRREAKKEERLRIARNLLAAGMSEEEIRKFTRITAEDLEELRKAELN